MDAVLVTGGAGFIGSHTVAALRAARRRVVVLDDFSAGRIENLAAWASDPAVEVVRGDVRAPLGPVLAGRGPFAAVIHLAAQVSVARSVAAPLADLDINLRATASLALWAAEAGVRRLVFASSAAVYGDPREIPISEEALAAPISPYGAGKRAAEIYLATLGPPRGLATTCLRLFNVYGPRQDPASPYAGVVAAFLARALAGQGPVIEGSGAQARDFVYVEDVARALVLAIEQGPPGHVLCNIGGGQEVTIAGLAEAACAAARDVGARPGPVTHAPARVGDIERSLAATGLAARLLGFRAAVPLAEGLTRTAAWMAGRPR